MMRLGNAALAVGSLLVVACAGAEDDSWNGAAGKLTEGVGGFNEGGFGADGGSNPDGGAPHQTGPTTATNTVTTGVTTGGTTSGGSCDTGSCDSCQTCAMNGVCAAAMDACLNDTQCYALIDCFNTCFDDLCMQTCVDTYPSGMTLYNAAGECIFCDACVASCGAC